MRIQMTPIVIDDDGKECRIGNTILIRTKKIKELSPGKITNIATTFITLVFDDPYIGYQPVTVRIHEIIECKLYM